VLAQYNPLQAVMGFVVLGLLLVFGYMLPTVIARSRCHRSTSSIGIVNFFLGWTLIGWVVSLAWAVSSAQPSAERRTALASGLEEREYAPAHHPPQRPRTGIGISFDLPNDGLIEFARSYDFASSAAILRRGSFAQNNAARDLRSLMLRSLKESWPQRQFARSIDALFRCGADVADLIASDETVRASNAAAMAGFAENGITLKCWVSDPDCCSRCKALDGTVISLANNFADGVPFPPLHTGCRCAIRAEIE